LGRTPASASWSGDGGVFGGGTGFFGMNPLRPLTVRPSRFTRTSSVRYPGVGLSPFVLKSVAALYPHRGLMSYGISKVALERLTVDCARQFHGDGIAVNCFRIDIPVASEGFIANTPGVDRSDWEPPAVAAEGIVWMLRQPLSYTGRRESMFGLREREGIMASLAERPYTERPPTELYDGLAEFGTDEFKEPHPT